MDDINTKAWSSEIDEAALAQWIKDQGIGNGDIHSPEVLGGGTQNILQRFKSGDASFVLRRPPKVLRAESNKMIIREIQVLSALSSSAVPHSRIHAACEDESVIGVPFYLMENVDGFNAAQGIPEEIASDPVKLRKMGVSIMDAILELGAVDYKAVGLEGFGKPDGYHGRQVTRWMSQLESYKALRDGWPGQAALPEIKEISRWLEANIPSHYTPGLIHGDCHLANMLMSNETGEINALIDWELSTIGDPLLDLGWFMVTLPVGKLPKDFPPIEELVTYYSEKSERDCSEINWYAVLASFKLAIILEGTFARACAGKADKSTGDFLHKSAVSLLKKSHQWI